jgi:hypothetical protein
MLPAMCFPVGLATVTIALALCVRAPIICGLCDDWHRDCGTKDSCDHDGVECVSLHLDFPSLICSSNRL